MTEISSLYHGSTEEGPPMVELRIGKIRGGFLEEVITWAEFWMTSKRWGRARGTWGCTAGAKMWRQQGTARMQGTPIAEDVGVSSLSRRQGWRGGCTEAHTKVLPGLGNCGNWKSLCGGGIRAWKTARTAAGILGWESHSRQGKKHGGGRVGEKYLGKHLIWQEGRNVHCTVTAETPARPMHGIWPCRGMAGVVSKSQFYILSVWPWMSRLWVSVSTFLKWRW